MKPILFPSTATEFKTQGLGVLTDATKKTYSNRFHTSGGNEAYSVMANTLRGIYGTVKHSIFMLSPLVRIFIFPTTNQYDPL